MSNRASWAFSSPGMCGDAADAICTRDERCCALLKSLKRPILMSTQLQEIWQVSVNLSRVRQWSRI